MANDLVFEDAGSLRELFECIWQGSPPNAGWYRKGDKTALRIHRAISWVKRAEKETDDLDAKFIFYWIAFDAAYGRWIEPRGRGKHSESSLFREYLHSVVERESRITDATWNRLPGSIEGILSNRYIFREFWNYHTSDGFRDDNWETTFDSQMKAFENAKDIRDIHIVSSTLTRVFERLYTMRCQFFHGSSSWNSAINRAQVTDGVSIMECLIPLFLFAMMSDPTPVWGHLRYPRYPDIRER